MHGYMLYFFQESKSLQPSKPMHYSCVQLEEDPSYLQNSCTVWKGTKYSTHWFASYALLIDCRDFVTIFL